MFVVVESGGLQSPYKPGRFRPRKVDPVQHVTPVRPVKSESFLPQASSFQEGTSPAIRAYEAVETMMQARRPVILAQEVMSAPVVSLPSEAKLLEAQDLIRHRRFRHLPVTTGDGQVIGMLSDRDVWRGLADPTAYKLSAAINPAHTPIHHFMSQPVLVARPISEVRAIARVMFEEHVGAMPIISETGELMGMLTRSDILRVLISHLDFEQWV
jgi:acetoin utilization protein AcuB